DRIDWTVTVTNIGTATVRDVSVDDPSAGSVSCPAHSLAPGASMHCTVPAHAVTDADAARGRVSNTATAGGTNSHGTPIISDPATASVTITDPPPAPASAEGTSLASTGSDVGQPLGLG